MSSGDVEKHGGGTRLFSGHEEIALAVNAFIMADKSGAESAREEKRQHLRTIQGRYWRAFFLILSASLARGRQGVEFTDDERMYMDLGLVDPRMLGEERGDTLREIQGERAARGMAGCYYLTDWLVHRQGQLQLETSLGGMDDVEDGYASQIREARRRVLSRLSDHFAGLPGIPLEVSESMRSGSLDNAAITIGVNSLANPRRQELLRRRSVWQLREQVLAKARARANNPEAVRLFDILDELYARDWRNRYETFAAEASSSPKAAAEGSGDTNSVSVSGSSHDVLMSEARQMRMRTELMAAIDGHRPEPVLHARGPRISRSNLAEFIGAAQTFDRALGELPPIVIVPGSGRGFFAWETGCVIVPVRPLVSVDDSLATAFAWLRMLDDRFNRGGALRLAFEKQFPGAAFHHDFPADYRAWLTRLMKGEAGAMTAERRDFFRDHIGPDIGGPILPPNLRNVGPQTMAAICRRLEKQLAAGDSDVNLHRRLAALYWKQGNGEAARLQFNVAMRLAPEDGETLFAAGMFMRSEGDADAARDCFRFGAERAKSGLWSIYCQDALANL